MSVIICTYNRADSLRRTLQTCCDLAIPTGLQWELLVVDNNSTDNTKQVCESFAGKLPLRYLFEPRQGKSHALNTGIAHAVGDLLIFTDDDVDVTSEWLGNYWTAAKNLPQVGVFGGRILPRWEEHPPRWVTANLEWIGIHVHCDHGDNTRVLSTNEPPFFPGANMALRAGVVASGFAFSPEIGPKGNDQSYDGNLRGEEAVFYTHLSRHSVHAAYVGQAVVYHRHPPHRSTERYLRMYYAGLGVAERRTGQMPLVKEWFGVPRYYWKQLILNATKYAMTRWCAPSGIWLRAESRMAFALGVIRESRRLRCDNGSYVRGESSSNARPGE